MTWPMYGYAFAKLINARREGKATWLQHLREDPKSFTKQSLKWLRQNA
jgi:hypothetical protein